MSESKPKTRATIDQAKAAWEAHPDPSIRRVIDALGEVGLRCSIATMQRWHASGWTLKTKSKNTKEATDAVVEGVERQNNKVLARIEQYERLEKMLEELLPELLAPEYRSQLGDRSVQERQVATILLSKAVQHRAAFIVETQPSDRVAKLLEVLQGDSVSVAAPIEAQPNGDNAKVVEGRLLEQPSETALAIEAFEQRRRAELRGVAA